MTPYHSETVQVCPDSLAGLVNVSIEFELGVQSSSSLSSIKYNGLLDYGLFLFYTFIFYAYIFFILILLPSVLFIETI